MNQLAVEHALCACLQVAPAADIQPKLAQWHAADWARLLTVARRQRVAPLLYARLKMHGWLALLPPAQQGQLQRAHYANCVRNLQLYQQLNLIITRLTAQAVPVLVLKGAALAATVYGDPGLRMMNDLDLLVDRAHLPAALAVMRELGYPFIQPPTDWYLSTRHHLPRLVTADGVAEVELHWTITPPGRYQAVDIAALWARAVTINVAGTAVLALSPTDQLLHLCLHASYQHSFQQGIRFLCDVDALLRPQAAAIEWNVVQHQAQQQGWARGLYLALYLAQQLLAAPVPQAVLAALRPADLTKQTVDLAHSLLFKQDNVTSTLSAAFVELWENASLWQRLVFLRQRLTIHQTILAQSHKITPDAWRVHDYLRHYWDMIRRYTRHMWRLSHGDDGDLLETKRQMALVEWLHNRAEPGL